MLVYLIYSSTERLLEWCEKLRCPIYHKGSHLSAWNDVKRKLNTDEIKEDEPILIINGNSIPHKEPEALIPILEHINRAEVILLCSNDRYIAPDQDEEQVKYGRALSYTAYITTPKTIETFKRRGVTSDNICFRTKLGIADNIFKTHKVMCSITKLRVMNSMLSAHNDLLFRRE